MATRREILKSSLLAAGGLVAAGFGAFRLRKKPPEIPVRLTSPSLALGHKLRDGFQFPEPSETRETGVLIVGGGMAGLSAAWRLQKKGAHNFHLLELENEFGGNSRAGENSVSKYPLGAHYVTLLNEETKDALELFEDLGVITGRSGGHPVYNEYYLCHAPHERLYINRRWQEGVLPKSGSTPEDEKQIRSFFAYIEEMRNARGADGRHAFTIPLDKSSRDPKFLELDRVTMASFMESRGWNSKPLNWYVNYCCRDDYGTPHSEVSAWAGHHYFCSRRGRAEDVEGSTVLTWPDGNGWIVSQLREKVSKHLIANAMATRIQERDGRVFVDAWDERTQKITRWSAGAVILAVPRFVAQHLGPELGRARSKISYSPWMVANVTLKKEPLSEGTPLSWDNVFYDSPSLGYINATHQRAGLHAGPSVWTYYRPLDHLPPAEARKEAVAVSSGEWRDKVVQDLSRAHPGISALIESVDVWIWGHAMARPVPGFIWGEERARMQKPLGLIHFAHSDMSGISIFEEANFQGVRAADEVLRHALG